jgi:hypothetical protein
MVVLLIGLHTFFKQDSCPEGKDLLEKRTALPCLASYRPYPKRPIMTIQSPFSTILKGIFPLFRSPLKVKKFRLYHLARKSP